MTDLIYLRDPAWVSGWLDIALLVAVAVLGLSLGMLSAQQMASAVELSLGVDPVYTFAVASVAVGFGVYLGRVLRRYSWDVILHPGALVADLLKLVRHPIANRKAWAFIAASGVSFFAATTTFVAVMERNSP